jgi:hypothetical protein
MKVLRWIGIVFLASSAVVATLVALTPTVLSTSWGQKLCVKAASHFYSGSIELDSLSIGWLSGIDVRNIKVKDPEGRDLFACSQCTLDRPLISLLFSQKDFGSIKVLSPQMYCYGSSRSIRGEAGQRVTAIEKKEKQENQPLPQSLPTSEQGNNFSLSSETPDFKGHVSISDAKVVSVIDDKIIGAISQGEMNLDLDLLHSSKGTLEASLTQGSSKPSPVMLNFTIDGAPRMCEMKGSFSFSCKKVPTELLASLAQSIHPDIASFLKEAFGNSISYSLSASANGPAIILHSSLLSDNVHSDLQMKVENNVVTLEKGTLFTGTLSPRLFHLISNQLQLPNSTQLSLLSPTACSLENKNAVSFSLSPFSLSSPIDMQGSTQNPLSLSLGNNKPPIALTINTALKGNPELASGSLDIEASSAANTAAIHLVATGVKKNSGFQLSTLLNITGTWPTIAETLTGFPATSLIGPEVTGVVKADGLIQSLQDFSFQGESQITSQNVLKKASFTCSNNLFKISNADFDAKVPASAIEQLGIPIHFTKNEGTIHLHSTVTGISIPLQDFKPSLESLVVDLRAKAEVPSISLHSNDDVTCAVDSAEFSITKLASSPIAHFSAQVAAPVQSKLQPLIPMIIGPSGLQAKVSGKYDVAQSLITINSAECIASRLSADIHDVSLSFGKGLELALASQATAHLIADKDMIDLLSSSSLPCTLSGPTEIAAIVRPFTLSQNDGTWQGTKISAEIQSKDVKITGNQSFGPYSLSIPVCLDIDRHALSVDPVITANNLPLLKGSTTLTLHESTELPVFERIAAKCSIDVSQMPTALLDLFSKQSLTPLIGDSVSSKLACTFNGLSSKGNQFSLSSSGNFWKANIDLSLDNMQLAGVGPNTVDVEASISPRTFEALKSLLKIKSDITIGDNVAVHIKVPRCNADLSGFLPSNTKQISLWEMLDSFVLSAQTNISAIQIRHKEASLGQTSPLTSTIDLQGKNHSLHFSVESDKGSNKDAMSVTMKGSFGNVWNKDGLNLSASHLHSTIDIQRFPALLLDLALPQQGALLEEAIGKTIGIVGEFSADDMKSGTAKFDLQSKNCTMHLDGIVQEGKLTLTNAATASLSITKQAGTVLLKNVNPLLATALHSQNPIRVSVDPAGAVIPLAPFSMTGVALPKITADVGKIVVKNGGALKIVLALLNMGQAANSEELDVWLTPIYMSIRNGNINCQRADALVANKVHMITWGEVNLPQDRMNMVIAIPQETLAALRLKIITPTPERGLQIPITGSPSNPKIDTASATARLAGAAIVDNVPDKRLQIFGGLLQAAAATVSESDKPIPPQTTTPFPWDR